MTSLSITSIGTRSALFSMKAAELKCQNLIVKKVCQVEHFKTFRKAIGSELGLSRPKISATVRGEGERDSVHKENYSIDIASQTHRSPITTKFAAPTLL